MRKINVWLYALAITLIAGTTFTSCSSDDSDYPAPEVSITEGQALQVDLRDGTTFNLPVNITSESGIESVTVKDVATGKEWKVSSFTDNKKITALPLDLSDVTATTQYTLQVVATAIDGKVTTATNNITLSVNAPELEIMGSDINVITGNEASIPLTIVRGLSEITEATIALDGKTLKTLSASDFTKDKSYTFNENVALGELTSGTHIVKVDVKAGKESITKTFAANASYEVYNFRAKKGINVYSLTQYIETKGNTTIYTYDFYRNPELDENYEPVKDGEYISWDITKENNKVTKIEQYSGDWESMERGDLTNTYEFTYDAENHLTKVTNNGKDYATDFVYENDEIKSYSINGKKYEPKYAEAKGLRTRVDYLDAAMSGNAYGFTGTEKPNPYYVPGLPAIIPGSLCGLSLQLIYNQYLFNSFDSYTNIWDYSDPSMYTAKVGDWEFWFLFNTDSAK